MYVGLLHHTRSLQQYHNMMSMCPVCNPCKAEAPGQRVEHTRVCSDTVGVHVTNSISVARLHLEWVLTNSISVIR